MTQIEELEKAVASLPQDDYNQFRTWFLEYDWEKWDRQLTKDIDAGKLDFLMQEALEAKKTNRLESL